MMFSKGRSLVHLVTCSELGVAVCTIVGITSVEEDASECLWNWCGALVQQLVEEGKLLCSGLESTTSAIESNDLGVGKVRSTLDGGLM
ncbi:hypothetical protein Tco_0031294 [Tanacetum coccineum]